VDAQPATATERGPARQAPTVATADARRGLVWAAFVLVTALYVVAVVLTLLGQGYESTAASWGSAGWIGAMLVPATTYAFPAVGALIAFRRPRNPIGWLCLAIGLAWGTLGVLEAYVYYAVVVHGAALPGWEVALAYANAGWIPGIGLTIFLVLLFPDGRLPSRRWRIVAGLAALTLVVIAITSLFGPVDFAESGYPEVANPLEIEPIAPVLAQLQLAVLLLPVWILAAALSIAVRFRRARGVERLQLKWLVAAGAAVALAFVAAMASGAVTESGGELSEGARLVAEIAQNVSVASFALIPISIGFATLRYRLYDIDVIVNRTLVYGAATVVLAGAFGVANIGSQRLLESMTGQRSDLLTGGLAVGAALAFGPMRRRIRPLVDRFLPARAELTLLFTDIVGSTGIAAEVGDERWRSLLDRYRSAVRRELARFGGREIDTAGDSFFATFDRPAAAVRCAWRMREAVRAVGLETRTGLHVGEVEMRGEKVSGLAVHTAARVMAAAADGEILVAAALRDTAASLDLQLADRGVHELKGVPGEWRLYRVEPVAAPTVAPRAGEDVGST
jgi:class 3 adenylate cyclase